MFSLINVLPSPFSADSFPSLFEWFIGTPPLSDSSMTCARVVRLIAFTRRPAAVSCRRHHRGLPVLVSEVSRCVRGLRLRRAVQVLTISPLYILPSANRIASAPWLQIFEAQYPAHLSPVLCLVGCLATTTTPNSGPSGSLFLTRRALSSPPPDRFIPAHPVLFSPAGGVPNHAEPHSPFVAILR